MAYTDSSSAARDSRLRFGVVTSCVMVAWLIAGCAARHGGPVIDSGDRPADISGTISGFVRVAGANTPLSARKVTAVEVATGRKYEASTASNGGYTMKVPMGRYRLEVELQPGESLSSGPDELEINASDLDSGRDFFVAVKYE